MPHPPALAFVFASSLALALTVAPVPVTAQRGPADGEWPAYNGDLGSTRYSPLDQVDASNVGELETAWEWTTRNFGPGPKAGTRSPPSWWTGWST